MAASRHLRVVRHSDAHTGEVLDECPECVGYTKTIRSQAGTIGNLTRQLTEALQEADQNHEAFPAFRRCYKRWKERCRHPRTDYDLEDFKLFLPLYQKHGEEMCMQAIEGAAYDPFVTRRKNGTAKRHDGWPLIFRKGGEKFREFANSAPYHLPDPMKVKTLANALAHVWGWEPDRAVHEAQVRLR